MFEAYLIIFLIAAAFIFIIYLMLDLITIKGGLNQFFDKWLRKTLWIWLPFYALQRLIKEVIIKK